LFIYEVCKMTPLSTIRSVLLASCALILVACGGSGSDSSSSAPQAGITSTPVAAPAVSAPAPAPLLNTTSPSTSAATSPAQTEAAVLGATEYTASAGLAQKGPLIKGSGVTVQELSKSLVPTGKQYSFQISSDLGTFEPNAKFTSQYVSVAAAGYYFDESSGVVSSAPITLYGLSDLSTDSSLNVNLLTMLAFQRIQVLITQSGLSFSAARAQAEGEGFARPAQRRQHGEMCRGGTGADRQGRLVFQQRPVAGREHVGEDDDAEGAFAIGL
jgi:hypothetical protein